MKNTVIWVLRYLAIPVAFIWSLGIFNITLPTTDRNDMYAFDSADYQTLEIHPTNAIAYTDSIVKNRKEIIAQGKIYEPYLYFRDLKQFKMFEVIYFDSLEKTIDGRKILLHNGMFGGMSELTNLRDQNWRNIDFTKIQNDGHVFNKMNITDARTFWFANQEARLLASHTENQTFFWINIWNWLVLSYFRGMLVALVLFLVWIKRFKTDCENVYWRSENLKQPETGFSLLSFIYALVVWPIVLIRDIRNRGKETLRKAEVLARRRDMFSLLSKEEEQLLKLGRRMSLRQFRTHLDERGIVRKHSILVAFCILPILAFCFHAKSYENHNVQKKATVCSKHCIDNDVGKEKISTITMDLCLPQEHISIPLLVEQKVIFFKYIFWLSDGFIQKPRGIPRCYLLTL